MASMNFYSAMELMSAKEVYGKVLADIGRLNDKIVVLTADLMKTNKMGEFRNIFPNRFFNTGIAEQNMMSIAAGLALEGKMPFVSTMATFASMRACEQVRTDICYSNLDVRIVATNAGLTSGGGATHAGQEDIAIMHALPNMTVIVPGDPNQIGKVLEASLDHKGPIYIRIGRSGEAIVYHEDYKYEIGKSIMVREGKDATIIACGCIVSFAIKAAERLAQDGVSVRVIDMHTVKPIDRDAIIKAARETGIILTGEDHNITGGLGSIVGEVIALEGIACKFKKVGIPDVYCSNGSPEELYHKFGYDEEGIYETLKAML